MRGCCRREDERCRRGETSSTTFFSPCSKSPVLDDEISSSLSPYFPSPFALLEEVCILEEKIECGEVQKVGERRRKETEERQRRRRGK